MSAALWFTEGAAIYCHLPIDDMLDITSDSLVQAIQSRTQGIDILLLSNSLESNTAALQCL